MRHFTFITDVHLTDRKFYLVKRGRKRRHRKAENENHDIVKTKKKPRHRKNGGTKTTTSKNQGQKRTTTSKNGGIETTTYLFSVNYDPDPP